jgi:hypothetical protein
MERSLSRERVCRLQLLMGLASAVILGSHSRETRDHILHHSCLNYESTALYNFHATRVEDTTLNSFSAVLLVVTGILCLADCYLVTTRSLLYVVTGT